jgi:hypothetical protein
LPKRSSGFQQQAMAIYQRVSSSFLTITALALLASCHPNQHSISKEPSPEAASMPVVHNAAIVSQEKVINFPKLGEVVARVIEADRKDPKLVFTHPATGKELLVFHPWNDGPNDSLLSESSRPILRFRIHTVAELPSPLIQTVTIEHGGSDTGFTNGLIGCVDGKLKVLTQRLSELPDRVADWPEKNELQSKETNPLFCNEQGGVFIGKLGKGLGAGIAIWQFIWEDNIHYAPHRYDIRLCTFDAQDNQFKVAAVMQTKKKHATGKSALAELGFLHYKNMLNDFPEIEGHRDNLE